MHHDEFRIGIILKCMWNANTCVHVWGSVISDDDYGIRDFRFTVTLYIVTAIHQLNVFILFLAFFFLVRFFFASFLPFNNAVVTQ